MSAPTRTQVESWNPAGILTAAAKWLLLAGRIEALFDQVVRQVEKAGEEYWEGVAAQAAQDRATADRRTAVQMADSLSALSEHAEQGYHEISASLDRARHAIAAAEEAEFEVPDSLRIVSFLGSPMAEGIGERCRELQEEIDAAVRATVDADHRLRDEIAGARDDLLAKFTSGLAIDAAQGAADAEALAKGSMHDEQLQRFIEATALSEDQLTALGADEKLTIPASQMAYMAELSRALNGKTPQEIGEIMNRMSPEGRRALANSFQLLSNPNLVAGAGVRPGTPAKGSISNLPDGVREALLRKDLVTYEETTVQPPHPARASVHYLTTVNGIPETQEIARIVAASDPDYRLGTEIDARLLEVGRTYLAMQTSEEQGLTNRSVTYAGIPADGVLAEPILQAVGPDKIAVAEMLGDPEKGEGFIKDVLTHGWTDHGVAASALFEFPIGAAAVEDPSDAGDQAEAERTGQIMEHVARTVGNGEAWEQLRDIPGSDGQSIGQRNPELIRTLAGSMSPYLLDLVGRDQPDKPGFSPGDWADPHGNRSFAGSAYVFALMDTDESAGRDFTMVAYETALAEQAIFASAPYEAEANNHLDFAARLSGLSDKGLLLSAEDQFGNAEEQKASVYAQKSAAYDGLRSLAHGGLGEFPVLGDVVTGLTYGYDLPLREAMIGAEPKPGPGPTLQGPNFDAQYHHMLSRMDIPDGVRVEHGALFAEDGKLLPYAELSDDTGQLEQLQTVFNKVGGSNDGHGGRVRYAYEIVTKKDG